MSITKQEFSLLEEAVAEYKHGHDTHESTDPVRIANSNKMERALDKLARELLRGKARA